MKTLIALILTVILFPSCTHHVVQPVKDLSSSFFSYNSYGQIKVIDCKLAVDSLTDDGTATISYFAPELTEFPKVGHPDTHNYYFQKIKITITDSKGGQEVREVLCTPHKLHEKILITPGSYVDNVSISAIR